MAEFVAGKYGLGDNFGVVNFGGIRALNATPGTPEFSSGAFDTFVAAVVAMSEGYLAHKEYAIVTKLAGTPSGDNASNYIATVTFQSSTSGIKYKVSIPGVKETLIQKDGRRSYTLTPAALATLTTAVETLLADTMLDSPFVYIHTRQS